VDNWITTCMVSVVERTSDMQDRQSITCMSLSVDRPVLSLTTANLQARAMSYTNHVAA
jgi:hypothetical protein